MNGNNIRIPRVDLLDTAASGPFVLYDIATLRLQEGVHQFVLAKNMGTSVDRLQKHYGHTNNIASAAELTKGGNFRGDKKTKTVDWSME